MSAITIQQQNLLPIIDNFVIVPDVGKTKRLDIDTALAMLPGSSVTTFFIDKQQRLFKLPAHQSDTGYPDDFYGILREAAAVIASSL
jgi:hypothetical protein